MPDFKYCRVCGRYSEKEVCDECLRKDVERMEAEGRKALEEARKRDEEELKRNKK